MNDDCYGRVLTCFSAVSYFKGAEYPPGKVQEQQVLWWLAEPDTQ